MHKNAILIKFFSTIMAFAGFMVASTAAQANLLSFGDFQGATKTNANINLTNNPGNTADDNLNMWLDGNQWTINTSNPANHFAQHVVTSDSTNMLFQGIDASGLSAGTNLTLSFDYALDSLTQANARTATVILAGLMNGSHLLDLNAGWFDGGINFGPDPDGNDGTVLLQQTFGDNNGVWQGLDYMVTLGQAYDVLAVAFIFSGPREDAGLRAVDNVVLNVAVPVPVPVGLLAFGLLAMAGVRRIRR